MMNVALQRKYRDGWVCISRPAFSGMIVASDDVERSIKRFAKREVRAQIKTK
jgi:hypothetical protein